MTLDAAQNPSARKGAGLLPREALLREGLAALAKGDLWLCAPSGYGKSVLARAMVEALSAEEDCAVFTDAAAYLRAQRDLGARVVFLDIEQRPSAETIDALNTALAQPGRRHRLLLATRPGSGVHLSKALASGEAARWGAEKLTFSMGETRRLLAGQGPMRGVAAAAAQLQNRSEGWPLGAALLARPENAGWTARYTPPSLREHFTAELMRAEPSVAPRHIMIAALPEQICAELYHCLTNAEDFAALTCSGLDLTEIAGAPGWWRFGALTRAHLLEGLNASGAEAVRALHQKAARWHLARQAWAPAAAHALETGDPLFAADIVNRGARHFVARGQLSHALTWLRRLGPEEKRACAQTWLFLVSALILAGEVDSAERELKELQQTRWSAAQMATLEGYVTFNRALLTIFAQETPAPAPELEAIAAQSDLIGAPIYGEAQALLGLRLVLKGDWPGAAERIEAAAPHLISTKSWYGYALSQARLAALEAEQGRLSDALRRCQAAEAAIIEDTQRRPPCLAPLELAQARIALWRGEAEEALERAGRCLSAENALRDPALLAETHWLHAKIELREGRLREAVQSLELALGLNAKRGRSQTEADIRSLWAQALLRRSDAAGAAERLGAQFNSAPLSALSASSADVVRLKYAGASALILVAQGRGRRGGLLLQDVARWAGRLSLRLMELETRLRLLELEAEAEAEAEAEDASEKLTRWRRKLRDWRAEADALGAPGLLALSPSRAVREFSADCAGPHRAEPVAEIAVDHNDLTAREREVLGLMAMGRTNKQIAETTMTALTTVKWHVRNILSKLDAQNRATAISKARRLGLIA